MIITQGNCSDTSECTIIDFVAIQNIDFVESIHLYPNPASEKVTIEFDNEQVNTQIELLDLTGKIVKRIASFNGSMVQLDIQLLSKGIYFIHVNSENGQTILRLEVL